VLVLQIFYEDSLKFFTSLYGHKLPVLTMDISQDSTILVTGSADKNIKFWGLDFGDCHRSIFAHSDSIMSVSFVAHTHYVFSVSKDKTIKYWDGDSFEHIATLDGHQAEVSCCLALRIQQSG
jgi:U3 small nucleolar RNA-associated protein 12